MVPGIHSESTSEARRRIDQRGYAYQSGLVAKAAERRAEEAEQRRKVRLAEIKARRLALLQKIDQAMALKSTPAREILMAIQAVASKYHVAVGRLMGESRTRDITPIRHEVYDVLVNGLHLSTTHAGRVMHRDHTTIMHGIKKYKRRLLREGRTV